MKCSSSYWTFFLCLAHFSQFFFSQFLSKVCLFPTAGITFTVIRHNTYRIFLCFLSKVCLFPTAGITFTVIRHNSYRIFLCFLQLAQLLPMEENFLLLFRFDNPLESSVEFMKVSLFYVNWVKFWQKLVFLIQLETVLSPLLSVSLLWNTRLVLISPNVFCRSGVSMTLTVVATLRRMNSKWVW